MAYAPIVTRCEVTPMNGSRDTPADAATMPGASGRPAKTAMIIAQRIVADIARDSLAPGASLPPERMMMETYEVGRGTLREALRFLEFQGVITLKPGPRGGVNRPARSAWQ